MASGRSTILVDISINYLGIRKVLHLSKNMKVGQIIQQAAKAFRTNSEGLVLWYDGREITDDKLAVDILCKSGTFAGPPLVLSRSVPISTESHSPSGSVSSDVSILTDQGQSLKLVKVRLLGVGAYGSVHIAMYGDTMCAAKIMHSVLAHDELVERFEQECELLRTIRHPCIVQFLDKATDPESGLPVLLMELMDQNLTQCLEKAKQPLQYHLQVNIFHDIATALSYIHSRGFIHRDVSSNNVLLVAGSCIAKLSDFGVSKLIVDNQMDAMTTCPGSFVYMAPECNRPSSYTNKVDVFSLGVVGVQIATCKFPKPSGQHEPIRVPNSQFPMYRSIPEVERRQNHIQLIPNEHCLKDTFLRCLQDEPDRRPSAHEVCKLISKHKESTVYVESVQSSKSQESASLVAKCDLLIERVRELTVVNETLQAEVEQLQGQTRSAAEEAEEQRRLVAHLQNENERLRREKPPQMQQQTGSRGFLGGIFRNREYEQQLQRNCLQYIEERDRALGQRDEAVTECEDMKRRMINTRDELEWSEIRLAERQRQQTLALAKYDDLQVEYSRKSHLLRQANQRVEAMTNKIEDLNEQLDSEREEVQQLRELMDNSDKRIEELLDAAHQQPNHQQSSAADQESLQGIMDYIRKTTSEQLELLKKQLLDREKELAASRERVAMLENELSLLREQQLDQEDKVSINSSEILLICDMCSNPTDQAVTLQECRHRLCKSCVIEVLNDDKDVLKCPVPCLATVCSNPVQKSDIHCILDCEELETLCGRQVSVEAATNGLPSNVLVDRRLSQASIDSSSNGSAVISKEPSGRYDLCPFESLPELKSKVQTVIHDDTVASQRAVGTDSSPQQTPITEAESHHCSSDNHLVASPDEGISSESREAEASRDPTYGRSVSFQEKGTQSDTMDHTMSKSLPLGTSSATNQWIPSGPFAEAGRKFESVKLSEQDESYNIRHNPAMSHTLTSLHSPLQNSSTPKLYTNHWSSHHPHPSHPSQPPADPSYSSQAPPHPSQLSKPPPHSSYPPPHPSQVPPHHSQPTPHYSQPPPHSNYSPSHPSHSSQAPSRPSQSTPHPSHPPPHLYSPPHPSPTSQPPPHLYSPPHPSQPPPHYLQTSEHGVYHSHHSHYPYHPPPPSHHGYPPPHHMLSWLPTHHRPRTAPVHCYPEGCPHEQCSYWRPRHDSHPLSQCDYASYSHHHNETGYASMGPGPTSMHSVGSHRAFTSPHPLQMDHYGHQRNHHHAYTERSIHFNSGHGSMESHHPPLYQPGGYEASLPHTAIQHSPFPTFQTDTSSLISSLRSSNDPDEYVVVLMQQGQRESANHTWKVVFTVCMRTPCCVKPLQDLLKEQFGEQFEVASFGIKFKEDAIILNLPEKEIEQQGYSFHTTIYPCKISKTEVLPLAMGNHVTPTYPPRHTLTFGPLLGKHHKRKELMVRLELDGIEASNNQREFCLKSPPVLSSPQQVQKRPPLAPAPATPVKSAKSVARCGLKELLQAEADTNSVATVIGQVLIQNNKSFEFCQQLCEYPVLKSIHQQAGSNPPQYHVLCEVIEYWRTHHETNKPIWEDIVIALKKINEQNLVRTVEEYLRRNI